MKFPAQSGRIKTGSACGGEIRGDGHFVGTADKPGNKEVIRRNYVKAQGKGNKQLYRIGNDKNPQVYLIKSKTKILNTLRLLSAIFC
jgi:hypothetical protein